MNQSLREEATVVRTNAVILQMEYVEIRRYQELINVIYSRNLLVLNLSVERDIALSVVMILYSFFREL